MSVIESAQSSVHCAPSRKHVTRKNFRVTESTQSSVQSCRYRDIAASLTDERR